ncbi:MAG: WG repeat-containing protein, partial [Taibaiella sp.]|nr:WG repeat-containing protein [Taibaiella sp.]
VALDYQCGCIDRTGKLVIPCTYDFIGFFNEGLAVAQIGEKYGYIDKEGKQIVPFIYDSAEEFTDGLAIVEKKSGMGMINKAGELVIPCKYQALSPFINGVAWAELNNKEIFIDKTGKIVAEPAPVLFHDGLAVDVNEEDDMFGFIDKDKNVVIPYTYDFAEDFSEGLALVSLDDLNGFIDTTGKVVIALKYESLTESFRNGLAMVELDGDIPGYIDKNGTEYWED